MRCARAPASACCVMRWALCASAALLSRHLQVAHKSTGIFEKSVADAPAQHQVRPDRIRLARRACNAKAMTADIEDMDRGGYIRTTQGSEIGYAIFDRRHGGVVGGQ